MQQARILRRKGAALAMHLQGTHTNLCVSLLRCPSCFTLCLGYSGMTSRSWTCAVTVRDVVAELRLPLTQVLKQRLTTREAALLHGDADTAGTAGPRYLSTRAFEALQNFQACY